MSNPKDRSQTVDQEEVYLMNGLDVVLNATNQYSRTDASALYTTDKTVQEAVKFWRDWSVKQANGLYFPYILHTTDGERYLSQYGTEASKKPVSLDKSLWNKVLKSFEPCMKDWVVKFPSLGYEAPFSTKGDKGKMLLLYSIVMSYILSFKVKVVLDDSLKFEVRGQRQRVGVYTFRLLNCYYLDDYSGGSGTFVDYEIEFVDGKISNVKQGPIQEFVEQEIVHELIREEEQVMSYDDGPTLG